MTGLVAGGYSPDGSQIIGMGLTSRRAWDAVTGAPEGAGAGPPPGTVNLAMTRDGHEFATVAAAGELNGTLKSFQGNDVQLRNEDMSPIGRPIHHDCADRIDCFQP